MRRFVLGRLGAREWKGSVCDDINKYKVARFLSRKD